MRCVIILLLLLLGGSGSYPAFTQVPVSAQWQRFLGDRAVDEDPTTHLIRTRHNRLAVAGRVLGRQSNLAQNPWLWLTTATGDSLTTKEYRQPFGYGAIVNSLAELANGDLLLYGRRVYISGTPGQSFSETLLIRTDSLGNLRWMRGINRRPSAYATACQPLPDGGAILVGISDYPPAAGFGQPVYWPVVTRIDSTGSIRWLRNYGSANDQLFSIAALPDGSYALAGWRARVPAGQTQLDFSGWWLRLDGRDGALLRESTFGIGPDNETFRTVAPTPDGGLLLGGSNFPNVYAGPPGSAVEQGLLLKVDSLDQVQWRQAIIAPAPIGQYGAAVHQLLPLPQSGDFLVAGERQVPPIILPSGQYHYPGFYAARYRATATGAVPVWEFQNWPNTNNATLALGPGGTATGVTSATRGISQAGQSDLLYFRLGGLPPVWQPTYCRLPPQALAAYTRPRPDSVLLYELALAGPPLAQLVRWRWQVGQPGQPWYRVVARDTATAGPLRLGYGPGQVPPAGTPVTLTVTNNLGCTDVATLLPFGPLSAAAGRAGAAALLVWPNPAGAGASEVRVQWPGLAAGSGAVAAEVLDALGRVVARAGWPAAALAGGATLAVDGLPPGLYALRLRTAAGATATARLVRE